MCIKQSDEDKSFKLIPKTKKVIKGQNLKSN